MAFTTIKNTLSLSFRDIRNNTRVRIVELGGLVVVTDDDANLFNNASKSIVAKYTQQNVQHDPAISPDADSEVRDTLRLYFRMEDQSTAHLDIPDPHDEVFLSTSGPGANVLKDYATLDAQAPGTSQKSVAEIIDKALAGSYLISDGEQPDAFLSGERVTWR